MPYHPDVTQRMIQEMNSEREESKFNTARSSYSNSEPEFLTARSSFSNFEPEPEPFFRLYISKFII